MLYESGELRIGAMKIISLIISIFLISQISLAEESIFLKKTEPAPFSGFLVPEFKIIELRNNTLERDMYKTEVHLKDQQVQILSTQNDKLAKTLESTSSLSTWEKIGYFAAGIIVTGLAIKGASLLIK